MVVPFGSYFYIFSNSFTYGSLAHAFLMFVMRKQLGQTSSISFFFFFGHLSSTLDIESSFVYRTQLDHPPFVNVIRNLTPD